MWYYIKWSFMTVGQKSGGGVLQCETEPVSERLQYVPVCLVSIQVPGSCKIAIYLKYCNMVPSLVLKSVLHGVCINWYIEIDVFFSVEDIWSTSGWCLMTMVCQPSSPGWSNFDIFLLLLFDMLRLERNTGFLLPSYILAAYPSRGNTESAVTD